MPLSTGAGDAQTDGITLAAQFAAGAGVPLHWLGRADAMQNRAVARESGLPWYEPIQRYQDLWRDVFTDLVQLVAWATETYGQSAFETVETDVTLDSPFDADVAETVSLMGAIRSVLVEAIEAGGSTLRNHQRASGELGCFQHAFAVYEPVGKPCPHCRCDLARTGGIQRTVIAGRATFHCPERIRAGLLWAQAGLCPAKWKRKALSKTTRTRGKISPTPSAMWTT